MGQALGDPLPGPGGKRLLLATARVDGRHHQDMTVVPGGQVLDQRHRHALLKAVRVIDDHDRRHLHRRSGDRAGSTGQSAVLPGGAVIPRLAYRTDGHPGDQEPDRGGQPGHEQGTHPDPHLGEAAEPVQPQQLRHPMPRRRFGQAVPQHRRLRTDPLGQLPPVDPGNQGNRDVIGARSFREPVKDGGPAPARRHRDQHHPRGHPPLPQVFPPLDQLPGQLRMPTRPAPHDRNPKPSQPGRNMRRRPSQQPSGSLEPRRGRLQQVAPDAAHRPR